MIKVFHIVVAMKPLKSKNFAQNALENGVSGINVDECRVSISSSDPDLRSAVAKRLEVYNYSSYGFAGCSSYDLGARHNSKGRWPANVMYDGSQEVVIVFPVSSGGAYLANGAQFGYFGGERKQIGDRSEMGDLGSAARFFKKCPKDD